LPWKDGGGSSFDISGGGDKGVLHFFYVGTFERRQLVKEFVDCGRAVNDSSWNVDRRTRKTRDEL